MPKFELSKVPLLLAVSCFLVLFDNYKFFIKLFEVYPLSAASAPFLLSIFIVFFCFLAIFVSLFSARLLLKPSLIVLLLLGALISYFANTYNVIIDESMIQNTLQTNISESLDLFSFKLLAYFFLLGILPSLLVARVKLKQTSFRRGLLTSFSVIVVCTIVLVGSILTFNKYYTSFFREHKPLRYYTNPTHAIYSAGIYVKHRYFDTEPKFRQIGLDARRADDAGGRKLVIMVVGEAARADHFSLNGYSRETNPLLQAEDVVNFPNMTSCGTSTAVSVPCMFSLLERADYDDQQAQSMENVLDVLSRAGVAVLWRDNNSSSKGVADRVRYENFRGADKNPICAGECRDLGMLDGLQAYVDQQGSSDILIVLHQMGNHGPAYFKRYPPDFQRFSPVCATNQLEECSAEEITNAYDNALLYSDFFLDKTIDFLKQNDGSFQTSLIYLSDHGESLGENGLYLHGLPYFIAPQAQTHVGAFMWFGQQSAQRFDVPALRQKALGQFSQDNLFHTLLGVMGVQTEIYQKDKDILAVE